VGGRGREGDLCGIVVLDAIVGSAHEEKNENCTAIRNLYTTYLMAIAPKKSVQDLTFI
jgi:hypothetical protein